MRLDKLTAIACTVGVLLGLLAAVSFADTDYPDEAGGSTCYTNESGNDCDEINNIACEEGVGDCIYCNGSNSFEDTFCGASTTATTCTTSETTLNCGSKYEGNCTHFLGNDYCEQVNVLIEQNGCSSMNVECTGTT